MLEKSKIGCVEPEHRASEADFEVRAVEKKVKDDEVACELVYEGKGEQKYEVLYIFGNRNMPTLIIFQIRCNILCYRFVIDRNVK